MSNAPYDPSYASYIKWDAARRERFPQATHWIYQSRIGEFRVADWCPLTGRENITARHAPTSGQEGL